MRPQLLELVINEPQCVETTFIRWRRCDDCNILPDRRVRLIESVPQQMDVLVSTLDTVERVLGHVTWALRVAA